MKKFKFIDLFAGIGGFHLALEGLGGECVFASEIDKNCQKVYKKNFPNTKIEGDITKINPNNIPKADVICAGFPCQPFSTAGNKQGFSDKIRGTLFFNIMNIVDSHKEVKFLILENVKTITQKQYFDTIKENLRLRKFYIDENPYIISPTDVGVPQERERSFCVLKLDPLLI